MYHPTLGRWLQRDPLGYVDGMSLYQYVASAPSAKTDAFGLRALTDKEEAAFAKLGKLIEAAKEKEDFKGFAANLEKVKEKLLEAIRKVEEGGNDPDALRLILEALKEWAADPGDRWGAGLFYPPYTPSVVIYLSLIHI